MPVVGFKLIGGPSRAIALNSTQIKTTKSVVVFLVSSFQVPTMNFTGLALSHRMFPFSLDPVS
jgi:hypothetical protein